MKINSALFFSILLATLIVATGVTLFRTSGERDRLNDALMQRSAIISDEFEKAVGEEIRHGDTKELDRVSQELGRKYRVLGFAYYIDVDSVAYSSPGVRNVLSRTAKNVRRAISADSALSCFQDIGKIYINQFIKPLKEDSITSRAIVVFSEAGYIEREINRIWYRNILSWLIQAILVATITVLIVRWRIFTPLKKLARWMKSVRTGNVDQMKTNLASDFLTPVHAEAARLAEAVNEARTAAGEEARLRSNKEAIWTPDG